MVDSGADTDHLTSYTVSANLLSANTTYYWRVRYQDSHSAWSDWSSEGSFTTGGSNTSVAPDSTNKSKSESTSATSTNSTDTNSTDNVAGKSSATQSTPTQQSSQIKGWRLSDNRVFLDWKTLKSANSYALYKQTGRDKPNLLTELESSTNYYLDESGIDKDTTYQLKAIFTKGSKGVNYGSVTIPIKSSDKCPELSPLTFNDIPVPQIELVTADGPRGKYIKERKISALNLSWQLPPETTNLRNIFLYRKEDGRVIKLDADATSYQDDNLTGLTEKRVEYELWAEYDLSKQNNPSGCLMPFSSQSVFLGDAVEPCLKITSPQKGEIWYSGNDYQIRWLQPEQESRAYAFGENYSLRLSLNKGKSYDYLLADNLKFDTQINQYQYLWKKIPSRYVSDFAQLKIILSDSAGKEICQRKRDFKIIFKGGTIGKSARLINIPLVTAAAAVPVLNFGAGALVNAAGAAGASGGALGSLFSQIIYFIQTFPTWLLGAISSRKKKRHNWGIVLTKNKQPIKKALVQLHQQQFGKVIRSLLTDSGGKFLFLISSPGQYFISVQKPGFKKFISRPFQIRDTNRPPINQSIYLKPAVLEENPRLIKIIKFVQKLVRILRVLRLPLLIIGSVAGVINLIIVPELWQYLIIVFYILLWLLEIIFYLTPRPFGRVLCGKEGIAMAIVRAIKIGKNNRLAQTYVSDQKGRFQFLLGKGDYQFKVAKLGYQTYLSPVYHFKKNAAHPNFNIRLKKNQTKPTF